jgi:Ni,Fe-hydrogenase III large subunit
VEARLTDSPFAAPNDAASPTIYQRALNLRVPIAEVEIARARDHLRWVASSLAVMGLPALALRTLRLAAEPLPDASQVAALARRLRVLRIPALPWAGRGGLEADAVRGLALGPVSRASGEPDDARVDEPAYRHLGFEPLIGTAGDAAERWGLRLREVAASLDLARRVGATEAWGSGVVESPRGRLTPTSAPFGRIRALVPSLLEGLEWGDAVVSLVSLDIDPSEVAAAAASEAAA